MSQDSNLMRHLASDVKRNRIASDQTLKCAKQQAKAVEGLGTSHSAYVATETYKKFGGNNPSILALSNSVSVAT